MRTSEIDFQSPLSGTYLSTYLQQQNRSIKPEVESTARTVLENQRDENAYLLNIARKYRIDVPVLNMDDIKKSERDEYIHGSELRGQVFIEDRLYSMWVVTFQIPYTGDVELLAYVPRSGGDLWYPKMFTENQHLCFEVKSTDRNLDRMRNEKDRIISFIKTRSQNIKSELDEYNATLEESIKQSFNAYKQRYLENKRNLDQL